MKIDKDGVWVSDREAFAQAFRAFLRPVVNLELLYLGLMVLIATVVAWVFQFPLVAHMAGWILGYVVVQVGRGLLWLYQPRLPWKKEG